MTWLLPSIDAEPDVPESIILSTLAVDAVGAVVDGPRWLSAVPFNGIQFGIHFVEGGAEEPIYEQDGEILEIHTHLAPSAMPALDPVGCQWQVFHFVLTCLNELGRRYDLAVPPPMKLMPGQPDPGPFGPFGEGDLPQHVTPLSPGGAVVAIEAELAGLGEHEVLVVALSGEGGVNPADDARLRRVDTTLEKKLGSIGGSSSFEGGYFWAVDVGF